ncbi:FAD binding domain protein [Aspergillus nomiae NRRL 13137]|uniref:FAD binding domain protein n=1 Tax=Aspergillus nomiae NRRL (strain ATCC 15546 / NRRL 13137 / CBS 260.88 / M93) TaxID=1509407 RepID=A0A0L1IRH6_ASPN3|nr:FAD binding domain protein [Aspergillus nomiae NRRL 13137]KNG81813.1 FAD binding domain protein [Aspergillus nomiae NRRL 13137]
MAPSTFKNSLVPLAVYLLGASARTCDLNSFNATVGGRVQPLTPFSLPCFSSYNGTEVAINDAACATIQSNYSDPYLRANSANGYMNNQVEMCASDPSDQCLLDSSDPTDPLAFTNTVCQQGNLPSYYLEIQQASDAVEAFKFASCSGTRLSIKNSVEDLPLQLQARGCNACAAPGTVIPAISIGAGVNFNEVYAFANSHNVTFLGGYAPTVGASGGFLQTAGHSILSPVYGLAIDRVIQFKVVTPDGQYRIANECQNQDLFWALRGGGGGTFGVVIESTHRVEPQLSFVAAIIKFTSNSTNLLPFMDIVVNNTLKWASEGWGGHISGSSLINVTPLLSVAQAEESLADVIAYAKSQGGSATVEQFSSWYAFYEKYVTSNAVSVGVTHFAGSRLVPKAVFETAEGRKNLMDFFSLIQSNGQSPYIPIVGPVLYNYTANSTSATPAWRSAIWELGSGTSWAWNSTLETREQKIAGLQNMTATLEEITPGSGAYSCEANPFTEDWQEAWWGENYEPLLNIKNKYDPNRLLNCWKCIGWEESDAKSSCFSAFS